jgi:hypothetical protein
MTGQYAFSVPGQYSQLTGILSRERRSIMRQSNAKLLAEQKPLNVIDVMTAGFEIVRKRPWTMLIPILMDVTIWLLPRIGLGDLFRPVLAEWLDTSGLSPDAAATAEQTRQMLTQVINSFNLLGLVSAGLNSTVRMPALLAFDTGDVHSPINALAYTFQLQSGILAVFVFVPLFLLALLPSALFIEWIAQGVRPLENEPRFAWAPRVAMLWLKLIGFSAILFLLLMAAGLVLLIGQMFSPPDGGVASLVAALVVVGWFWIAIYFFFTVCAMAVSNVGILEAIRRSVLIFRFHFWASLLLFGLTIFLDRGLALVWHGLAITSLGVLLGIAANAFIGTALLAASMVFYQDRMTFTERRIARARVARR